MAHLRLTLFFVGLAVTAFLALACGTNSDPTSNRQLLSITLSPTTADAQQYPNGEVQFVATGHYGTAPSTVTPLAAGWGSCYQNASTKQVTVNQSGVAQCASGAVGTYTVWANDVPLASGANCLAMTACGGGCFVAGTAQLTCP